MRFMSMRFTSIPAHVKRMGAALALVACTWLPGAAFAQGILMGSASIIREISESGATP